MPKIPPKNLKGKPKPAPVKKKLPAVTGAKEATEGKSADGGETGDLIDPDSLEGENIKNSARNFTKEIKQVEGEYQLGWWFMKPKWDEWALRLKLYNNQKRDKAKVGDPELFTIHQTVLASLYDDQLSVAFNPREEGDTDTAENLDAMAEFDYDEMEKDMVDYAWDWDTTFFGRGLVMLMEFDRVKKCPIPENWDPMVTIRDPNAVSVNGDAKGRGAARFIGREIRLTKQEMKDAKVYFNFDSLKADAVNINSLIDRNQQLRQQAQGYADTVARGNTMGDSQTYLLLEWITRFDGKLYLITLADNRKRVIRFTEIRGNRIPIIDRSLYPISHDWDGVSIPDIVEDKQRARAKLINLGVQVAEAGLHPSYVFDNTRITNRAELNMEVNKFIGVAGNPNNAIVEVPRSNIHSDANWVLETLQGAGQRATATPDLQQGAVGQSKRTATELNLVDKKVDTRYSLSAKIFGWSEKRFWQQWYFLYKEYFQDGIDEKVLRITGALGTKFRPLRRANIIAQVDPDIKIESRVLSEARKYNELQIVRGYVQMIALDPNSNLRYALKYVGRLSGLKKDVVNLMLPPVVDEMVAEEENDKLEKNVVVAVQVDDDHVIHLEVHNKLSDTPAKYAHIQAHKRAMVLKKVHPELFPTAPSAANPTGGAGVGEKGLPKMTQVNNATSQ
jgi:hypothetical protein